MCVHVCMALCNVHKHCDKGGGLKHTLSCFNLLHALCGRLPSMCAHISENLGVATRETATSLRCDNIFLHTSRPRIDPNSDTCDNVLIEYMLISFSGIIFPV